jgi:hypothetical protein
MRFRNPPKYCHFCREHIPKAAIRCVWCFRPFEAIVDANEQRPEKVENASVRFVGSS